MRFYYGPCELSILYLFRKHTSSTRSLTVSSASRALMTSSYSSFTSMVLSSMFRASPSCSSLSFSCKRISVL